MPEKNENIEKQTSTIYIEPYEEVMQNSPENINNEETELLESKEEQTENQSNIENSISWQVEEIIIPKHTFNRAFEKEEITEEIEILQKILYKELFIQEILMEKNDQETRNALYLFQLQHKIMQADNETPWLRGYFGPSTRKKMNELLNK
jgi:hypothetical protein